MFRKCFVGVSWVLVGFRVVFRWFPLVFCWSFVCFRGCFVGISWAFRVCFVGVSFVFVGFGGGSCVFRLFS